MLSLFNKVLDMLNISCGIINTLNCVKMIRIFHRYVPVSRRQTESCSPACLRIWLPCIPHPIFILAVMKHICWVIAKNAKKGLQEIGISRLYFDHIKMLCDIVVSLGKRPVLWADIALKYPEYIHLLPKETIFVDWNYGWALDRFGAHEQLVKSGYEIWGAPSIRSSPDNYYLTRWLYHFNNIRDFIPICKNLEYKGIVMTSWSTSGVYSPSYESEDDLVELYALRHVYPITGFNILISAYIKAMNSDHPLDINQFIKDYCRSEFGFDESHSEQFQKALFTAPYTITNGKVNSPAT